MQSCFKTIDFLLQCKVPALVTCGRFGTPLDIALRNGHTGCVAMLQKFASDKAGKGGAKGAHHVKRQ